MQLNGQLHALTTLFLRKDSTVHTEYEVGWASQPVLERKISCPARIKPCFLGHLTCNLVNKLTELYQLPDVYN